MKMIKEQDLQILKEMVKRIGAESNTDNNVKLPYRNEFPFTMNDDALEHIGFAALCFELYLELFGEKDQKFLKNSFILACIVRCGDGNDERDNIANGYTFIKEALRYCCADINNWHNILE